MADDAVVLENVLVLREKKKRKRRSLIWNFFDINENDEKCICKECGKSLKPDSSTTSLRYHIKNLHPHLLENQNIINLDTIVAPFDADKAEELLAKFIAKNCLSFRIIDSDSFLALIDYLQPKWKVCTRQKLAELLVPALRVNVETSMKERMKTIRHYSISLDSWTSLANRSYLAITAHGITKNFVFESFLLDIVVVKKAETAEMIAEIVMDVLQNWNIDITKVIAGASDAASNCKKAIKKNLNLMWVYCAAHAINRSVRLGLQNSDRAKIILKKVKKISKFFRASPKASKLLLEQQQRLELPIQKMTIDNKTRWGSAYLMFERLLQSRPAISSSLAIISGTRRTPPPDLTSNEWQILSRLHEVLKPLHESTKILWNEKYPIISFVVPVFWRILVYHLNTLESDDFYSKDLKEIIHADLTKRWGMMIEQMSDALILSVYLDIRLKNFSFIPDEGKRNDLIERGRYLCEQFLENPDTQILSQGSMTLHSLSQNTITSQEENMTLIFGDLARNAIQIHEDSLDELVMYHQKKTIPFAIRGKMLDPLLWWQSHEKKYPKLAKHARRFLCIIASSVPCERVFSKSGFIVHKRRVLLSDVNVSNLVFISCNS